MWNHVICLQVVEASAAANKFVSRPSLHLPEVEVAPIQDFVVAFPTMNAIHGQDSWWAEHVSEKYGDHTAWNVGVIIEMLQTFFAVSGAISLPDLAEYEWRLDKVKLVACMTLRHGNGISANKCSSGPTAFLLSLYQHIIWCRTCIFRHVAGCYYVVACCN